MAELHVELVSVEREVWSGEATQVTARTTEGEIGVLPGHAPLLGQLADVPDERRGAHFTCAVAWVLPDGRERVVEGRMPGRIIRELRGSGGFGYDVLFVADAGDGPERTSAELPPEEKDAISHRGKAIRDIAPVVADVLTGR